MRDKAIIAVRKALKLEPDLAEAHVLLANVLAGTVSLGRRRG